jgi:hypothetical protein
MSTSMFFQGNALSVSNSNARRLGWIHILELKGFPL